MTAAAATMPIPTGGLEQRLDNHSSEKHSRKPSSLTDRASAVLENITSETDSFIGSTLRSTGSSYMMTQALPVFFANPIAGIIYGSVGGAAAYVSINVAYKLIGGGLKLMYNIIRHPVNSVGTVFDKIADFIGEGPFRSIKKIISSPKVVFDYLFKGGKSNVYGRALGTLLGGGVGLSYAAPELFGQTVGNVSHVLAPGYASAKSGALMAASNVQSGFEGAKELANDFYWKYYFTR